MAQSVLVTGGAGFIGSHLVRGLLDRGDQVRVLDDLSTGFLANLEEVLGRIEFLQGDLRDEPTCRRAVEGVEVVYHLGALGSVPRSLNDPLTSHAVNVTGTLNLLRSAQAGGIRRFVFSSSSSVYGNVPDAVKHEELRPRPCSPYAVSKLAGEEYCRVFKQCYGLETVVLRYFNVFGPRQNPDSQYAAVIPRFMAALRDGRRPIIYGDGQQSRDFTYVANVVAANLLAGAASEVAGLTMNIACGERIVLADVLAGVQSLMGNLAEPVHEPEREGDVRHSLADISLATRRLGYRPEVRFDEGLRRTVAAFRKL